MAFSPDGKRLASASGDHTIKIWDVMPGPETGPLTSGVERTMTMTSADPLRRPAGLHPDRIARGDLDHRRPGRAAPAEPNGTSGQITDLNSLIPAGSGWVLNRATGINDAGQIVGSGTINGVLHVFLLTPQ